MEFQAITISMKNTGKASGTGGTRAQRVLPGGRNVGVGINVWRSPSPESS